MLLLLPAAVPCCYSRVPAPTQAITDPGFTLQHPALGEFTVKVYGAFDGKASCTIGGNFGPKSLYPVWSTTSSGRRLTDPVSVLPIAMVILAN